MGFGQGQGRDHLNPQTTDQAFQAYESVRHRLPSITRAGACQRVQTLDDIADQFDVFLLDAFGVLNIGETAIEGVPDRVAGLQASGKQVLVVTNAAGYPHASLMAKYSRLGYDFSAKDVISSRKTILHAVRSEHTQAWGVIATEALGRQDIDHLDMKFLAEDARQYSDAAGFLMLGSAAWTEERQVLLEASLAQKPRPVLVGNPDIVAPREDGFSIEPGQYAHRLADMTGITPRFFGKPFQNIFDLVFARLGSGVDPARVVMVGDSLHTDILGGQAAGVRTALIEGFGFFAGHTVAPYIQASGIQPDFILERP